MFYLFVFLLLQELLDYIYQVIHTVGLQTKEHIFFQNLASKFNQN